jgi:hypothetical protein
MKVFRDWTYVYVQINTVSETGCVVWECKGRKPIWIMQASLEIYSKFFLDCERFLLNRLLGFQFGYPAGLFFNLFV